MNKRGVQAAVIGGILALLIIAMMLAATPIGQQYVRQILGFNTTQFIPSSNFTPYSGPEFTDDEVKMINSVNAITCAFNAMAFDTFPYQNRSVCKYWGDQAFAVGASRPQGAEARPTTPVTGRQTVQVSQGSQGTVTFGETSVTCNEPPLTLRTVRPTNANELAGYVVQCWEKFRQNNFNNVWCNYIDASGVQGVSERAFFEELNNNFGDVGDDIAGAMVPPLPQSVQCNFNLVGENYEWYDDGPEGIGCTISAGAFVLCGDNAGTNEIHISRDLNKCIPTGIDLLTNQVRAEELLSKTCTVTNFQLPQRIEGDWKDYMRGNGDPSFVLYYEAFPAGEEEAWITDTQEHYFRNAVFFNVAFAALPLVGTLAKHVTLGAGRLFLSATAGTLRIMGRAGEAIAVNTIGRLVRATGSLVGGFRAYASLANFASRARNFIISGAAYVRATGQYVINDAAHFVAKFRQADQTLAGAGAKANQALLRESAEEILQATSARALLEGATARAIVDNPAAATRLAQELGSGGTEFAQTLLFRNTDNMFNTLHQVMKNGKTEQEVLEALNKVYPEAVSKALIEGAKTKQIAEVLQEAAKNPEIRRAAEEFSSKYATARALTRQGTVHSLAYAAAVLQALADSQNNKFKPIGVNALGMHRPYEIPLTTDTSELFFPLVPELRKKFIALQKDTFGQDLVSRSILNQGFNRFFLASPCYADITLQHQLCQCAQPTTEFSRVNFGAGEQLVQTASIYQNATDPYDYAVKECVSISALGRSALPYIGGKSPVIATQCVAARVDVDTSKPQNFCYSGAHVLGNAAKGGILVASIGASVWLTVTACAVPPGIGCAGAVVGNIAIDTLAGYLTSQINEAIKWPVH